MIEQDLEKWLTQKELKRVVKLDKDNDQIRLWLDVLRAMTKNFSTSLDELNKEKTGVLNRARKSRETFWRQASRKGNCPRQIENPKANDGHNGKCPVCCKFREERVVGYEEEYGVWVGDEYLVPVWKVYCLRGKQKIKS